ncbi:MAG: hypothetical protein CMB80_05235 [Flammeovirgaceae bacterium]|nr:hypothetical protein [Flammeovirgaceae bacterium]|tara:strand:+ start:805 stop:1773 length:969 start_codon:yes stop_codon:yes gene_type:complete
MGDLKSRLAFLRQALGPYDHSPDGLNYAFKCPGCGSSGNDKKKLIVHIGSGNYHCWVCELKGRSPGSLIRKYRTAMFEECQKLFGGNYRVHIESTNEIVEEKITLPPNYIPLSQISRYVDPDVNAVIRYAKSRDLSERDFWYFKLGTCAKGKYRRRLIIPSFDEEGCLNYYVARVIDSGSKRKYFNPKIAKSNIIFNEININWNQELTLVEGPFDLMKCDDNASCILGSSISERHAIFKKIVKHQTPILLALDPDAIEKTHNYAKLLSEFGICVRILDITGHEDVGSMSRNEFIKRKNNAMVWKNTDRLYHVIRGIKSGSII